MLCFIPVYILYKVIIAYVNLFYAMPNQNEVFFVYVSILYFFNFFSRIRCFLVHKFMRNLIIVVYMLQLHFYILIFWPKYLGVFLQHFANWCFSVFLDLYIFLDKLGSFSLSYKARENITIYIYPVHASCSFSMFMVPVVIMSRRNTYIRWSKPYSQDYHILLWFSSSNKIPLRLNFSTK